MKVISILAAVVLSWTLAAVALAQPAAADTDYAKPQQVQVLWTTDTAAGVACNPVKNAKYYIFRASTRKDMKNVVTIVKAKGTIATVDGLRANTKFWFQAAVADKKGKRLSSWSKVSPSAVTQAQPNV